MDPPPVVEFRIFDETAPEAPRDITMSYNASFFLFATLENARQFAHGRVQPGQATAGFPVLTGVPVAGISYLDRPNQAGYFIFPDLSVRHEGHYCLSFNLFEEVKSEKNGDKPIPGQVVPPSRARNCNKFRLEVKSGQFQVFSAKKFPGLKRSTHISRIVAEQGCRVRIRRDVRMRRRDNKPKSDFDGYEEEGFVRSGSIVGGMPTDPYAHPPHTPMERPRSISHGSMDGQFYPVDSRRPSMHEATPHAPVAYVPPPGPVQAAAPVPWPYGAPGPVQYQNNAPPATAPRPAPGYQYASAPAPAPAPTQVSAPPPYSAVPDRRPSLMDHDYNNRPYQIAAPPAAPYSRAPTPKYPETPVKSATSEHAPHFPQPYPESPMHDGHRMSVDERMAPASRKDSYSYERPTPVESKPSALPSLPSFNELVSLVQDSNSDRKLPPPVRTTMPDTKPLYNTAEPAPQKRSHGLVFGNKEHQQPLHSGMRPTITPSRPSAAFSDPGSISDEDFAADDHPYDDEIVPEMTYRRADGFVVSKSRQYCM